MSSRSSTHLSVSSIPTAMESYTEVVRSKAKRRGGGKKALESTDEDNTVVETSADDGNELDDLAVDKVVLRANGRPLKVSKTIDAQIGRSKDQFEVKVIVERLKTTRKVKTYRESQSCKSLNTGKDTGNSSDDVRKGALDQGDSEEEETVVRKLRGRKSKEPVKVTQENVISSTIDESETNCNDFVAKKAGQTAKRGKEKNEDDDFHYVDKSVNRTSRKSFGRSCKTKRPITTTEINTNSESEAEDESFRRQSKRKRNNSKPTNKTTQSADISVDEHGYNNTDDHWTAEEKDRLNE